MVSSSRWVRWLALGWALALVGGPVSGQDAAAPATPGVAEPQIASRVPRTHAQWEKEIAAFEALDRDKAPPQGGILFTGSSTIRLWKTLATDYPGLPVINRGFGGSEISDATHFADRIIFPYKPKQIILRAGGNDIHNGRLPSEVAADFAEFVRVVHARLPKTEILYVAVNPAPVRWSENDKVAALNRRIRELAVEMPFVGFIDTSTLSLTPDGQPRPELFVADRLHFSPAGYNLLAEAVRPYLPLPK